MKIRLVPPERPAARVVLTPSEMGAADAAAIDTLGVPGPALMENAGRHVAAEALGMASPDRPIVIVCGGGNNGGDGYVAARHLSSWGRAVRVYAATPRDRLRGGALINLDACLKGGVSVVFSPTPPVDTGPYSLVIDALLGTGLNGPVRPAGAAWIQWMNAVQAPSLSVDVPSGLCSLRGQPLGPVVTAEVTVTFACSKWGHWLFPGPNFVGELVVVDIGMPDAALEVREAERWVLDDRDLEPAFTPRPAAWHKGAAGRVWILGGSPGRTGAVRMAADGAMRAGAGLVTIGTTASAARDLGAAAYEVMVDVALESDHDAATAMALWASRAARSDAIVMGPGYPGEPEYAAPVLSAWAGWATPAVIDADGLNHLARAAALTAPGGPRVLTPHPGEAARLLACTIPEIEDDRPGALRALVGATASVVVLKGAHTLVGGPNGQVAICPAGNPGMASAGMGDVLSGVIGALLARGVDPMAAACAGVLWHARAGDIAGERRGENALMARDVVDALSEVERQLCS